MKKLSVKSRIIVAIASLSLIATYFLPIWRIDLFAPQYPEGLFMNIWLNDIKGQVDIINGLNHYIGMRKISVEMFPEFAFLGYVVAFYIAFGLTIAIIGNRKILFWYLVFTIFGGSLALYDYYRWGYDYGHNLDPMAAIQVPGLSYQPPLIGHKRILNFDAYSFPDSGGWIIIGAASVIFLVWLYEWRRVHKMKLKLKVAMATALIPLVLLTSCSTQPETFKYGTDNCHSCKMTIIDPKFGCEVITGKGKVYKFDDVICVSLFLKTGEVAEKDIKQTVVINFEKENNFLDVNKTFFVLSPEVRSPMNSNAAAFASREAAEKFNAGKTSTIINWKELLNKFQ